MTDRSLTAQVDTALARDVALIATGLHTFEEVAARHKLADNELADRLNDPAFSVAVVAETARAKADGAFSRALAANALNKALELLQEALPDLPPSGLARAAEALQKVAARGQTEQEPGGGERFGVIIQISPSTPPLVAQFDRPAAVIDVDAREVRA